MTTRRLVVNLTAFAVLSVVVVAWAAISLFGTGAEPVARVTAHLEATGGLRANSDVTYLGQPVGRVEGVDLRDTRVDARLRLDRSDLPAEVTATVRRRSAVGEPYLDLAPTGDAPRPPRGPALVDGDVVGLDRTALPRSYTELFASVSELFNAVDADDLGIVLGEIATALDGQSTVVQRVLRDGAAVAATLADRSDVIEQAIDEVAALTATLEDQSGPIAATFDDVADIGDALDELGADYATLVGQDDAFLARSTAILRAARGELGCVTTSLTEVAEALDPATLAELDAVLDASPRVAEIIRRVRDDRADGSTWLTVSVLLSERAVGDQAPRRDRDPEPPALDTCAPPAPASQPALEAATDTDDRTAPATDPAEGIDAIDRDPSEDRLSTPLSTQRDLTGDDPPVGAILMALGALALLGTIRPWRWFTGDAS